MRDQYSTGNEGVWEGSFCNWVADHRCPRPLGRIMGAQVCAWSPRMTQGQLVKPCLWLLCCIYFPRSCHLFWDYTLFRPTPAPHTNTRTLRILWRTSSSFTGHVCSAGSTVTLNDLPLSHGAELILFQASQPLDLIAGPGSVNPQFPGWERSEG